MFTSSPMLVARLSMHGCTALVDHYTVSVFFEHMCSE